MKPPPDSLLLFDKTAAPARPDYAIESDYWQAGFMRIAGVDEAGRGPLAGPVVAAAVVLDADCAFDGLNDSKKLTALQRDRLFGAIMACANAVSVASVCATAIDASDIRKASLRAMILAVKGLALDIDSAIFDGRDIAPGLKFRAAPKAVIKGDGRSLSIAAASVVAKVQRDRMMARLGRHFPDYGLEQHRGYGSQKHRDCIAAHGGLPRIHRFSFSPLRQDR